MTSRLLLFSLLALGALLVHTGCEPGERVGITAEVDDPGYRRGKDLLRQGRNQEALSAFLKVIEKRGEDAAESHLEAGLLYQFHIKDSIAAIYHYRKFRELKPNSPQADLVRQRIDGATREFASTLPGDPLNNAVVPRYEGFDQIERFRRENEALKAEVATLRTQMSNRPPPPSPARGGSTVDTRGGLGEGTQVFSSGTTVTAVVDADPRLQGDSRAVLTPVNPPTPTPSPGLAAPTRPTDLPVVAGGRRHVVAKGDTLMSLALRYYGDRSRWRDIYAANRAIMRAENDLRIGSELRIP
ncbi:MAG TPA: LysM peptidoglycan-binding domain-containing protein [Opitutaceae bacterium]|nr:LysM peptidoglycan-binding domain-containing protein [Opitutaceae bacterium]